MKYLGVDFGIRRVGLALSEGELATPYKILRGKNVKEVAEKVYQVAVQENFDILVVGMPERRMGKITAGFVKDLKKLGLNVETADETLSTQNASKLMIEMGIPQKKRRANDAQAAAEILQNYLDQLKI